MTKALTILALFVLSPPVYAESQIVKEALSIVDDGNGKIRRWEKAPSFVVVHDARISKKQFTDKISEIGRLSNFGDPTIKFVRINTAWLSEKDYQKFDFTIEGILFQDVHGRMVVPDGRVETGNIFVFVTSTPLSSYFQILTHYGGGNMSLQKAYLSGDGPCYVATHSNKASILISFIFLNPDLQKDFFEACVHEELYQSMGIFRDAHGSEVFNFDNTAEVKPIIYDKALLRSLYSQEAYTGMELEEFSDVLVDQLKQIGN